MINKTKTTTACKSKPVVKRIICQNVSNNEIHSENNVRISM